MYFLYSHPEAASQGLERASVPSVMSVPHTFLLLHALVITSVDATDAWVGRWCDVTQIHLGRLHNAAKQKMGGNLTSVCRLSHIHMTAVTHVL